MYPMPLFGMVWMIVLHDEFEFDELSEDIKDELMARLKVLDAFGPSWGSQTSTHSKVRPFLT